MKELTEDLNKSEQITFPVTFELKVIMDATIPEMVNKENIQNVLSGLNIPFKPTRSRLSAEGRYMSFTYSVTIDNHPLLKSLYERLRALPGIKFAV